MRMTRIMGGFAAATAAIFLLAVPASAQDDDGGPITQGDDARYLSITFAKFKPGHREKGMEMITEYFVPATEKSGTNPPLLEIHFQTGKWDAAWVWALDGGMADLEWYRSPDDIKWFAALAELNGGAEQAEKIWQKFLGTIAETTTEVGHHHVPGDN